MWLEILNHLEISSANRNYYKRYNSSARRQNENIWKSNLLVFYSEPNFNPNVIGTKAEVTRLQENFELNSYCGRVYCIESNRQNSFNSRKDRQLNYS